VPGGDKKIGLVDLEHLFYYNRGMSVLRRFFEYLLSLKSGGTEKRVFLQDEELISVIQDLARQQQRAEEDVAADFMKAGLHQYLDQEELEARWTSLSHREQQVVALLCLGHRNHEIAQMLVIAPETVKTHLQRIFDKFNLRSRKELRLALKNWDFREWWEQNNQQE
jgi:ATP/maltotriose-dependent transcriptional regulator MalT